MDQGEKYTDERLLMEMRQEGVDVVAYERLFHRYYPMVFNFTKAIVKSPAIAEDIAQKINSLHEFNPMLGFRGCRLAVVYPEILKMQVRAIMEAAINVKKKGFNVLVIKNTVLLKAVDKLRLMRQPSVITAMYAVLTCRTYIPVTSVFISRKRHRDR